jgi:hypothetical protein
MEILQNPVIVPLGALLMVAVVVIVDCVKKLRERELEARCELRLREMEHERRMRELEAAFEREPKRARV